MFKTLVSQNPPVDFLTVIARTPIYRGRWQSLRCSVISDVPETWGLPRFARNDNMGCVSLSLRGPRLSGDVAISVVFYRETGDAETCGYASRRRPAYPRTPAFSWGFCRVCSSRDGRDYFEAGFRFLPRPLSPFMARQNASTSSGSNWVPAHRLSSSEASR